MEDISPCDLNYFNRKVIPYALTLLSYDYVELSGKVKKKVDDTHVHLMSCHDCYDGLMKVIGDMASDPTIATDICQEPTPPETFGRFERNQRYLNKKFKT